MAHFAQLDHAGKVLEVIVVNNTELLDEDGVEQEALGVDFCVRLFGGLWVQTSYNETFRKNFASIGDTYDAARDAFIPPKPFTSWLLNETTCLWEAPIAMPDDGNSYRWDEATTSWVAI